MASLRLPILPTGRQEDVCADNTRKERTAGMHWKEKENEDGNDEDTQGIGGVGNGFERFKARESIYCKEN